MGVNKVLEEIKVWETFNYKEITEEKYLVQNRFVTNSEGNNLLLEVKKAFSECEKFYFSVNLSFKIY